MATVTFTGAGADNKASTGLNWDNGSGPSAGDAAVIDGAFPVTGNEAINWDIVTNLASLTVTSGYTSTVTQSATLNVHSGGTAIFTFNGGTWNSNGQSVQLGANGFDASGSATKTLTLGSSLWFALNGGGTWDFSGASLTVNYNTSTLRLDGSITLIAPSVGIYNLEGDATGSGGTVVTVSGTTVVNGYFDMIQSINNVNFSGGAISLKGDFKRTSTAGNFTGSTVITFNGTGSQTWTDGSTGAKDMRNPITINKASGTLFLSGNLNMGNGGPFTWTTGTVDGQTSTMNITQVMSINSGTMPWYNFTVTNGSNPTFTGNLQVNNTLLIDTATIFNGSSRTFTVNGNLTITGTLSASTSTFVMNGTTTITGNPTFNNLTISSGATVHLTASNTFTVSGLFSSTGTSTLNSTSGGTRANLAVNGSQNVVGITATDIDSSGGSVKPIHNIGGVNSNTVSWDLGIAATVAPPKKKRMLMGVGL